MLTIKKSNLLLLLLTVIGVTSLFVVSCHNKIGKIPDRDQITIQIPEDHSGLDTFHHYIDERSVNNYKSAFKAIQDRFQRININVPDEEAFNKRALLSLLKAPDCVGIRIYHGVKTSAKDSLSELRLVLVGVDSKGNDILIDESSALTLKLTGNPVGVENGQCPNCHVIAPPNNK